MTTNYLPEVKVRHNKHCGTRGRYYKPETHNYPDQEQRNRYYAYIKHRAQAKHRGELYELTAEDWFTLWTPEQFARRGRGADSLTLVRIDPELGWCVNNVEITTRKEFLREKRINEAK